MPLLFKIVCDLRINPISSTGLHYIVDGDIKEFTNLKLDSVGRSLLTIMRHCQRLKEIRGGGLTRYSIVVWFVLIGWWVVSDHQQGRTLYLPACLCTLPFMVLRKLIWMMRLQRLDVYVKQKLEICIQHNYSIIYRLHKLQNCVFKPNNYLRSD